MSELSNIDTERRLNADIATSGQSTETQLTELKALGIEHVVKLGLHSHKSDLSDEAATAAAPGRLAPRRPQHESPAAQMGQNRQETLSTVATQRSALLACRPPVGQLVQSLAGPQSAKGSRLGGN